MAKQGLCMLKIANPFKLKCTQATQLLSEAQDRTLSKPEQRKLWLHTCLCTPCKKFGEQVKLISQISKQFCQQVDDDSK